MNHARILILTPCLLAAPLAAQLRINELLLDPPGANAGNQIVELINPGSTPFNIPPGWSFCIRPDYPFIPQFTIPAGGIVRVHFGATGTDTATDWYIPNTPELLVDSELAIYSTQVFYDDPNLIVDFASWGQGQPFSTRAPTAVTAGLWPSVTTNLVVPAVGHTLARFDTGTGPSSYFDDSTPTLGGPNMAARTTSFGAGCAGTAGVPALAADPSAPLPWLGTPFTVRLTNLPAGPSNIAFMIISLTETPAASLAGFGMPGCNSYLTPDVVVVALGAATITHSVNFPANPIYQGVPFLEQAMVLNPGANALGMIISNPQRSVTGLR